MALNGGSRLIKNGLSFLVDTNNHVSYNSGSNNLTVTDLIGKNVGTLQNNTAIDGNDWDFAGDNDYIAFESTATTSQNTTIDIWYTYSGSVDGMLLSFGNSANATDYINIFVDYLTATEHRIAVTMAKTANGAWQLKSNTPYPVNSKYHNVTVTKGPGGNSGNQYNCIIYVNGSPLTSGLAIDTAGGDYWFDSVTLNRSAIGALYRSVVSNYHTGKIDSVKVYDRVLTPTEVEYNYNVYKKRFGIK